MSTVLITGATGFIGSFLAEHYARLGWRVVGTYRHVDQDRTWLPAGATLRQVDLSDRAAVVDLIASIRPDVVQHLAAQSSVAASWRDPMATLIGNSAIQYNVLQAVLATCPEARVVVASSCDVYGQVPPECNPVGEHQELQPLNPYALSKVVQELMARQYATVFRLPVLCVRPFLQLGPRRSARFAVGSFARQIAEIEHGLRRPVLEVGNVDLVRDFTDVRDASIALALVAEHGTPGQAYNLASGVGHTLRQVLEGMLRHAGMEAQIRTAPALLREGETPTLIGDSSRLRAATGWTPQISFEQSTRETLAHWQENIRHGQDMHPVVIGRGEDK